MIENGAFVGIDRRLEFIQTRCTGDRTQCTGCTGDRANWVHRKIRRVFDKRRMWGYPFDSTDDKILWAKFEIASDSQKPL